MYPVSSGFEEWIHLDSFGQKRETLLGAIVICIEPTLNMQLTLQSCDSTNQIMVSTFRHQHTETRLKLPDSFPKESGARETSMCASLQSLWYDFFYMPKHQYKGSSYMNHLQFEQITWNHFSQQYEIFQ